MSPSQVSSAIEEAGAPRRPPRSTAPGVSAANAHPEYGIPVQDIVVALQRGFGELTDADPVAPARWADGDEAGVAAHPAAELWVADLEQAPRGRDLVEVRHAF